MEALNYLDYVHAHTFMFNWKGISKKQNKCVPNKHKNKSKFHKTNFIRDEKLLPMDKLNVPIQDPQLNCSRGISFPVLF